MDASTTAAAARHSALPFGPFASFTIAMVTLSVTSFLKAVNIINNPGNMLTNTFYHHHGTNSDATTTTTAGRFALSSSSSLSNLNVYNVHDVEFTHPHAALRLTAHTKTNRTLWQVINSSQFHAGVQRVEPLAWIPSQSYDTEALLIVVSAVPVGDTSNTTSSSSTSGVGAVVYNEHGFSTRVEQGAMIHVRKNSLHAIQNPDRDHALLLVWTFPTRFGVSKAQFRDNYDFGVDDPANDDGDINNNNAKADADADADANTIANATNTNANGSGDGVGTNDGEANNGKE